MREIGIIITVLFFIGFNSCDKSSEKQNGSDFESFCILLPDEWSCEIYQHSLDTLPVPEAKDGRMENPLAIIQYTNSSIECSDSSPFWLQVYDISKKDSLEIIIDNSRIYSWCIPMFFGENDSYYVITSPCYLYRDCLTNDSIINPLLQELKGLFTNSIID